MELKGEFEVCVLGVERYFFDFCVFDVIVEGFFDVPDASLNIFSGALGYHFDGAVEQVPHHSGQLVAAGYIKGGKAKAYALDCAGEDYVFGGLTHLGFYDKLKRFLLQANNSK